MFQIISSYLPAILDGLATTLSICALVWIIGLTLGSMIGVVSYKNHMIGSITSIFSFLIISVPVLVLLFWVHYPLQAYFEVVIDPYWTTVAVLSLVNIVLVSSIIRDAGKNVPNEFLEAAKVYGVSIRTSLLKIELPLILRQSIPALLNTQVAILHMSLFASLISVNELFRAAQRINSLEYQPIPIYSALAIFYLLISLPLNLLAERLKIKYGRDLSER